MARKLAYVVVFLLLALSFASPSFCQTTDYLKNGGESAPVGSPQSGPLVVPPGLPYGTRVRAVVDYPSASNCIRAGDYGTVYCYDADDPVLPYLVHWDRACGSPQSGCGRTAPHGWWVGFDEISVVATPTNTPRPPTKTPTNWLPYPSPSPDELGKRSSLPLILRGDGEVSPSPTPRCDQVTLLSVADACAIENYADKNFGDNEDMWAGYDDNPQTKAGTVRALVRFDLSRIPVGANVTKATLRLHYFEGWDYPDRTRTCCAHRIDSYWGESTVTWRNQPGRGEGYDCIGIKYGDWGWKEWDVTSLVKGWLAGSYANYGLYIIGDESSGDDSGWRGFSTRESSDDPQLVISYN